MVRSQDSYTISRLAAAAGVNIETIRYYQRIGLIVEPRKPLTGYRIYPHKTLEQITFIKRAQQLGFSLQEIAELLALGTGQCRDVRKRAEQKRDKISRQIKDLQALKKTLDRLITACDTTGGRQACPIVETLTANQK